MVQRRRVANMAVAQAGHKGGTPLHDVDIGFDLERLFDTANLDHVPYDKRMELFEHRNLPHIKHYKAAVNIFGGPQSRKRTMVAPPMETPLKHRLGVYHNRPTFPTPPKLNGDLNTEYTKPKVLTSTEETAQEEKDKEASYKSWYAERRALRGDLDGMGLSEAYLRRKSDKTELEKRVERRLMAQRLWKPETPPPPTPEPEEKAPPVVPVVKIPVPKGLQILDTFLSEKKMRLIDIFRNADRNNDWKLTKEELQSAITKYRIPLDQSDVEDMLVALDRDNDEQLDFKELSQGIATLKAERRTLRRQKSGSGSGSATTGKTSDSFKARTAVLDGVSPFTQPDQMSSVASAKASREGRGSRKSSRSRSRSQSRSRSLKSRDREASGHSSQHKAGAQQYTAADVGEEEMSPGEAGTDSGERSPVRSRPASGHHSQHSRSSTPNSLEPPAPDTRDEKRQALNMEEMLALRKHDKTVLDRAKQNTWPNRKRGSEEAPGVIRIGHAPVDQHCLPSTLEGEQGALMDKFRRQCLREYFQVIRVCQEKGLVLNAHLLDRVLLYPPEMPASECKKMLALPTGPLSGLTDAFAKPPRKPKTPPEIKHKDKMKRSKNGTLMIDVRHMYPPWAKVAPVTTKENLSTGRALVSRTVDAWMSFEEYDKYTKHLPRRYKQLSVKTTAGGLDPAKIMAHTKYKLDAEKFWPGHVLDKLVLYEPRPHELKPGQTDGWQDGHTSVFHNTFGPRPQPLPRIPFH